MKQLITLLLFITATTAFAQDKFVSLDALNQAAKARQTTQPNVPLAELNADFLQGADVLESGRIPNYARGLALLPKSAKPLAETFKAYLYSGTIAPEIKMAMGLRIAQIYGSAYPAVHLQRLLRASERGQKLLTALQTNGQTNNSTMTRQEQSALHFAEVLTRDVQGLNEADFSVARGQFNDSQIVELTMTTCFFNYFLRYCEGANLPVEKWALDEPVARINAAKYVAPPARVAIVSDEQMSAVTETLANVQAQARNPNGLGIGIANSQRAFLLVPDITKAWRAYTTTSRDYNSVNREIKLHVSFAISMTNGCRY